MNQVRRVVKRAGWRLTMIDSLRVLAVVLTVGIGGVLGARFVERLFALGDVFAPLWPAIFLWTGVGVVALSVLVTLIRRRGSLSVARELDERAGLKEALSTAFYIEKSQDPWSRAVVDAADRTAGGVRVTRAIPMEAPRLWPVPLAAGLALTLAWYTLPNWDPFGKSARKNAEARRVQEVQQVKAEINSNDQKIKDLLAKAKVEFVEEPTVATGDERRLEVDDPDALRRAAVKRLTDLSEKIEAQKEGEKAAQIEAIKEAMRQLRQPGQGPLNEFTRSLAKGDFNKAQDQLQELAKELAGQEMTPEDRDAVKKQMENLAKQLEKLAQSREQLEKKLEEQGLDKKTAQELARKAASGNPDDLKQALEQAQNLTPEQKKQLLEMAKAATQSQGMCDKMSEGLSKMAQGMTQEGLQQEGMEGMGELSQALSESEMLQSDMQNLDAALDEAKEQLAELAGKCMGGDQPGDGECEGAGEGAWREGTSRKMGQGSGGPGRGNGASPESTPVDFKVDKSKAKVANQGGPIIGSRLVYGEQVRGESRAQFEAAVAAGQQEAADAIEGMQVHREYHDAVKHYFGKLEKKVKDTPAEPPKADKK